MSFIDTNYLPLDLEFKDILITFTLEALKKRPNNLYEFASDHFENIIQSRPVKLSKAPVLPIKSRNWLTSNDELDEECLDELEYNYQKSNRRFLINTDSWSPFDCDIEDLTDMQMLTLKSEQEIEILRDLLSRITIFNVLSDNEMDEVVLHMKMRAVDKGDVIIRQGDVGDFFYVIQSGKYEVFVQDDNEESRYITSYTNKGYFGELSLLYNTPRGATVIAKSEGFLWYMCKQTFRNIGVIRAHIKRLRYVSFVSTFALFSSMNDKQKMSIAEVIHMRAYAKNMKIITQGEIGNDMYFIESGKVSVYVQLQNTTKEIMVLGKGNYFGELALMTNQCRLSTVVALEKTVVGVMDKSSFNKLLRPCMEILKQGALKYERVMREAFGESNRKQ